MKNTNIINGGKILGTGGFGCIFSPALRCNDTKKRSKNTVSKLMLTKYAEQEHTILLKLNNTLKIIPNYENYFLINDFSICKPSKLTKTDLTNFQKCKTLKKNNITKKNVNSSLEKLMILNMPYGGETIDTFILKNRNYEKLVLMNNKMILLLISGICVMNKMNIYHNDIKDSNILIDYKNHHDVKVRLIDWGLTVHYIPFKNEIFPKHWRNRPLQFNVPFSVILFTDMFYNSYSNFLKEHEITINTKNITVLLKSKKSYLITFIKNYIKKWIKERGLGHYKYINKIIYCLFIHDIKNIKQIKQLTNKIIVNYLVEVVINFTFFKNDGSLNMREYLDTIFIHIVDIYGFIISYFPLYELFYENFNSLNEKQLLIFKKLKKIFIEFLYKPRIQVIDIDDLVNNLKNINKIIYYKPKNISNKLNNFRKNKNSFTRKNFKK
jgi:serine/threonine protein kinase